MYVCTRNTVRKCSRRSRRRVFLASKSNGESRWTYIYPSTFSNEPGFISRVNREGSTLSGRSASDAYVAEAASASLGAACALRVVNWPQHVRMLSHSGEARQNQREIHPRKAEEETELRGNAPRKPIHISPAMSIARCSVPPFPGPLWGRGHCAYEERVSEEGGEEPREEEGEGKGRGKGKGKGE
jgi:hypothetical protein